MRKTMNVGIVGGTAFVVLLLVALASVAQNDKEDLPEVVIDNARYDMGEVFERDEYAHVFQVRNKGSADLRITKVKPG